MQGKLSVDEPISKYLDGVPADKAGITLHHLLTHSSGLESDFSPTDYEPVGREEYVRRALQSTLLFKPGEGYEYSNAGYSLLAAIVEKVSGQWYEAYLTEHVLKPAGMRETGYKAPGWAPARVAHGYRDGEDWGTILQRIQAPDAPYWMLRGNGGLHTTLGDMLAWHRSLDTDAVLSKEARAKYFKPYVAEGPRGHSFYAYGWAVGKTSRGTSIVQHNGGNGIYVAEFLRFPDEDAMLFLTSTDAGMKATPVVTGARADPVRREVYTLPPGVVDLAPARAGVAGGPLAAAEGRHPDAGRRRQGAVGAARPRSQEAFAALGVARTGRAVREARRAHRRTSRPRLQGRRHAACTRRWAAACLSTHVREQEAGMMRRPRIAPRGSSRGRSCWARCRGAGGDGTDHRAPRFREGVGLQRVRVGSMRLLGIRGMPQLPGQRFVPVSDHEFVAFSLEGPGGASGGAGTRLVFEDRAGETVLVLGPAARSISRAPRDHRQVTTEPLILEP